MVRWVNPRPAPWHPGDGAHLGPRPGKSPFRRYSPHDLRCAPGCGPRTSISARERLSTGLRTYRPASRSNVVDLEFESIDFVIFVNDTLGKRWPALHKSPRGVSN